MTVVVEEIRRNSIAQRKAMACGFKRAKQWHKQWLTKLQWFVLEMSKHYLAESNAITKIVREATEL